MSEDNSKYYIWQSFLLGLAAAIGLFAGLHIQQPKADHKPSKAQNENSSMHPSQKWNDVMSFVQAKYIDTLNEQQLIDKAINGFLTNLDPYSDYYSASEATALQDEIEGDYKGIGIECLSLGKKIYISNIIDESPAHHSSLKIGDELMSINNHDIDTTVDVQNWTMDIIRNGGDSVQLKVKDLNGVNKDLILIKKEIDIPSVDLAFKPSSDVIYVKLNIVGEKTYREFMEGIEKNYDAKTTKKLILDLRDNTGGLVHIAADILNQLVKEKEQLLFTTKNKTHTKEYKSLGRPFFKFDKIVVLVNENTASAAEIISGSLQDQSIAYIIGTPTLGKGTLLEQFTLSDQSLIRLAVGRFYLPSGRCPQKPYNTDTIVDYNVINKSSGIRVDHAGIIPDERVERNAYPTDLISKFRNSADRISFAYLLHHGIDKDKNIATTNSGIIKDWIRQQAKELKLDSSYTKYPTLIENEVKYSIAYQTKGRDIEFQERLKDDPQFNRALLYLKKN